MDEKNHPVDIFKTVADFSPAWLMWLTDEKTVAYASPATKTITGYEPREFMDDPGLLQKILHPEERGKIFLEFADAAGETHDQALEFRIVRKDGSVRWISHRCRLAFDDNNKRVGRISSNTDVTERKLKESALLEKEKLLQSIFDGMPDPAHIIDRDYRVVLANKRMLDLKNLRQEEIAGKHCYEVYQQRAGRCESCASKEVFATGNPCSLRFSRPAIPVP
jgi:PAS domain S-box-containing protein